MWSVPCQLDKCCCCRRKTNYDPDDLQMLVDCRANFKPYENIKNGQSKFINDYVKLSEGTYRTNEIEGCCTWIKKIFRTLLFIFYLCLFFPLFFIGISVQFTVFGIGALYQIIISFIRLYFCCNFLCFREYVYHGNVIKKVDNWSFMTFVSSEIEERRFGFYKAPVYIRSFSWHLYLRTCQYLAGLFRARLISDDMIIYWVHLWSTTKSQFVYDYDPETKKPIRIRGIIDDYSSWSSNESVAEFWENTTFEILSVFIDYDDKCRITFNLRNGGKIMEPRFDTEWDGDIDSLTDEQLNELRVWNIHKAHYQCLISIYPALIHTWSHFHFNDLILRYIETYWNDNPYDDDAQKKKSFMNHNVLNRIIRSHTYYTSSLNAAGHNDGFVNPQMKEWNWCEFICAPWKVLPGPADILRKHFVQDTTQHYFCDIEQFDEMHRNDRDYTVLTECLQECLMDDDEDSDETIVEELMVGPAVILSSPSTEIEQQKQPYYPPQPTPPPPENPPVQRTDVQKQQKQVSFRIPEDAQLKKKRPSYRSQHSSRFNLNLGRKPSLNLVRSGSFGTSTDREPSYSSKNYAKPKMIAMPSDASELGIPSYDTPSTGGLSANSIPMMTFGPQRLNKVRTDSVSETPISLRSNNQFNTPIPSPFMANNYSTPNLEALDETDATAINGGCNTAPNTAPSSRRTSVTANSILIMTKDFSLNADIDEEEVDQKTHTSSNTMVFNKGGDFELPDIADNPIAKVPTLRDDIEITISAAGESHRDRGSTMDTDNAEKTANPDAFPPPFVRNRLKMFRLEFPDRDKWIAMHRGYSIYKDYLADYYECIHEQFVLPLYKGGYITDPHLTTFVNHLENDGFPGLLKCKRNGGYLHIFTTFLWLNVVHSSDHTIANNLIRDFGIGASYVPMYSKKWYDKHKEYNFVDVLEGKTCGSRWRLQWYAMKNRLFWYAFGGPQEDSCLVADYFIDSNLYKRFSDVDHINNQQRTELNRIHKHFIKQMKQLDICYRWLMPVENITSGVSY